MRGPTAINPRGAGFKSVRPAVSPAVNDIGHVRPFRRSERLQHLPKKPKRRARLQTQSSLLARRHSWEPCSQHSVSRAGRTPGVVTRSARREPTQTAQATGRRCAGAGTGPSHAPLWTAGSPRV